MRLLLSLLLSAALTLSCTRAPESPPPNIVYILADDLGYGDVSVNNPRSPIKTRHIDRLAANGIRFTDAHSGSAVCTPTRYGILTGRYAWRTWIKEGVTWSWDQPVIPSTRTTVASYLKERGYATACIGKWHLGLGWQKATSGKVDLLRQLSASPNDIGFDYFFGIAASLDIPPYVYIENNQATASAIDTIDAMGGMAFWRKGPIGDDFEMEDVLPRFTQKAVSYIESQAESEHPFFLYFPLPAPHTPILPTAEFVGKSTTNAYGDFVLMVDDVVRQIVAALEKTGQLENTLLVFTSDNGCSPMADFDELVSLGHDPSAGLRGHKADIFEGGHRIPFVAQWPAQIPAGVSNQTVCLTDLLATAAAILNDTLAANEAEDSYSILPLLRGTEVSTPIREATVHHSINGSFAIRQDKWKLIFAPGSGGWSSPTPAQAREEELPSLQLYDLSTSLAEQNNVVDQYPEVVERLTSIMNRYIDDGRSTPGVPQSNDVETSLYYARDKQ